MFKRLIFRFLTMLIMMAGVGSYLAYLKGHSPLELFAQFGKMAPALPDLGNLQSLEPLKVEATQDQTSVLQAGKTTVYKWRDAAGQWHYGQTPPDGASGVESMVVNSNQNVIASVKPAPQPAPAEKSTSKNTPQSAEELADNPYSPETVKKLFEDARHLQEQLNTRAEMQQQLFKPK